jgi:hypothetical protein
MKTWLQEERDPARRKSIDAGARPRPNGRLRRLWCALELKLVASGYGRIALHVLVAVKTGHYLWHFHGIARELVHH